MSPKLIIWSVIGAISLQAVMPPDVDARGRYSFRARRNSYGAISRRRSDRRQVAYRPKQSTYYQPVSYLNEDMPIAREPASSETTVSRDGIVKRKPSIPQGDDRFPIAAEPRRRSLPMPIESSVTLEKANSLRHYAQNQPYEAMRKLLGNPSRRSEGGDIESEVYDLKGGNQYQASRRLVINYRLSPDCDYKCLKTISWNQQ